MGGGCANPRQCSKSHRERQLRAGGVAVGGEHGACSFFARSSAGVESHRFKVELFIPALKVF